MIKEITIICQYCREKYTVENSAKKHIRDWNIDSAYCPHCGKPRNERLNFWGEVRRCKYCEKLKPISAFHNRGGYVCEMCHKKRGYEKQLAYNLENGNNKKSNQEQGIS
jgi:hypothetical protein